MAEDIDYQRLRLDLGLDRDDLDSLSDESAEMIFDEAGESYTDAGSIKAATRIIAIDRLLIQAAADVDYTQNENSKKASQRYAMLERERAKWEKRLQVAVSASSGSGVKSGRTTRKPARIKEYPYSNSWGW